jgi:hypothetical protein
VLPARDDDAPSHGPRPEAYNGFDQSIQHWLTKLMARHDESPPLRRSEGALCCPGCDHHHPDEVRVGRVSAPGPEPKPSREAEGVALLGTRRPGGCPPLPPITGRAVLGAQARARRSVGRGQDADQSSRPERAATMPAGAFRDAEVVGTLRPNYYAAKLPPDDDGP